MRRNRTLSCFVPLPRTENAYTVKPNKEHSPTALFRLETKKVVYTCEQGSATIMFKWANSYYVRDVVKSCLADKLLSVQKSVQNLFSKLSIESVTEPSLTPTTQSIGANIQTLLQSNRCASTEDLHMHHIRPKRLGGSDTASNIMILCGECHRDWHYALDKVINDYWRGKI